MRLESIPVSWVDISIVLLILVGVFQGRKRGMSEELLDVLKWLAIVVSAAYLYGPLGRLLSAQTVFGRLASYLMVYLGIVLIIKIAFTCLRHNVGEKLIGSDIFGGAEYYLGMLAGAVRYGCVIIVVFALLHARYYTPEEINAESAFQQQYFGAIRFPTLISLQRQVFAESAIGASIRDFLPALLIQSTPPDGSHLGHAGIVQAREMTIQEILDHR